MFEKVNPSHPDKIADRIAGAIVDLAYKKDKWPKIAVEVLIGHGHCNVIAETSVHFKHTEIMAIVLRIAGSSVRTHYYEYKQDVELAKNQDGNIRCGDNGIFKGCPITHEERELTDFAKELYELCPYDGKYIVCDKVIQEKDENHRVGIVAPSYIICQSHIDREHHIFNSLYDATINPLGYWTGGINVDSGATNRKIGSDMGSAITGGGLHGKDLTKADVSVNIYAFLQAQELGHPVEYCCAIGDETIDGRPYSEIVEIAQKYIEQIGGFEKLAEWGLIR